MKDEDIIHDDGKVIVVRGTTSRWVETRRHEYKVVGSSYLRGLEQMVTERMNEGWVPVGGVSSIGHNHFYQAMTHTVSEWKEYKIK